MLLSLLISFTTSKLSEKYTILGLFFSSLSIILLALLLWAVLKPSYSKVNFYDNKDRENIFVRNKERFLVEAPIAINAGVVGAIAGSLVTYLLTKK